MRAGAQARTIFAGLGVTGSLVGAIGAVFATAGGVLALTGWPDAPSTAGLPALQVAAAARTSAPHRAPALQIAAPAPAAVRPATAAARRPSGARRSTLPTAPSQTAPVQTGVTPQASVPAPTPPITAPAAPAPPSSAGLGTLAENATDSTASTVRQVGTIAPVLTPVTNTAADTVQRAGHLLGPILQGLSGQR